MQFSHTKPAEPGWYIAKFSFWYDLIQIKEITRPVMFSDRTETLLQNMNGASTHFSRWDCEWSERLELPVLHLNL
jgi:hypothetical protein